MTVTDPDGTQDAPPDDVLSIAAARKDRPAVNWEKAFARHKDTQIRAFLGMLSRLHEEIVRDGNYAEAKITAVRVADQVTLLQDLQHVQDLFTDRSGYSPLD